MDTLDAISPLDGRYRALCAPLAPYFSESALQRHRLPGWAAEIGCDGWAQAVLKFIVSHPAVTCAIPATSQVAHVVQNMGAARGAMPNAALRARMAADVAALV